MADIRVIYETARTRAGACARDGTDRCSQQPPKSRSAAAVARDGTAAQVIGQPLYVADASRETNFEALFAALAERRVGALIVSNDPFFNSVREHTIALAARHRIPAIYDRREYTIAGGLMSYGTSYSAAYRELGVYTGKILKGARPADLPGGWDQQDKREGSYLPSAPAQAVRDLQTGELSVLPAPATARQ